MKLIISGLLVGAIAINGSDAYAQARVIKDSEGSVYLLGAAIKGIFTVKYQNANAREIKANSCGLVYIAKSLVDPSKNPFPFSKRDGSELREIFLPGFTKNKPDCFNGTLSDPTYNTESTDVFNVARRARSGIGSEIVGTMIARLTPNEAYLFFYPKYKKIRSDACGTVKVKNLSTLPVNQFIAINEINLSVANLPIEVPPLCRNGLSYFITAITNTIAVYKGSEGNLLISNLPPNSVTNVSFDGTPVTKTVLSDSCGSLVVKNSVRNPLPRQVEVLQNGATVIQPWDFISRDKISTKCINGQIVPDIGYHKTLKDDYVFVGLQPNTVYQAKYALQSVKSVKANACGIGRIKRTSTFEPSGIFMIDGDSNYYSYGDLQPSNINRFCRNGVLFAPKQAEIFFPL